VEEQESFHPRLRLYFWQVIAARVPRESMIHSRLGETASRRQSCQGLVRESDKEPLILRLLAAREVERFGRTR